MKLNLKVEKKFKDKETQALHQVGEVFSLSDESAERINDLAAYQINQDLMNIAGPKAVFMHCLPAYHDHKTTVGREMGERFGRDAMEVTDEVFEGPQSIVFDEAENRMHTIKAVMAATLGYNG